VENRRRDFICLHALAHVLLAQALQVDDEELKFERVQGKLACESARSAGLAFSLSYTRGRAVCAVGRASRLGVDIERVQPLVDFDCLAESVLSEAELRFIRAPALQSESVDNFYALWTLKEAYLKALEVGLTVPLRDISFDLASCQGGRPSSDTPLLKGDSFLCVAFQERDFIGSLVYEHNQRWPLKILHFGPSYVARLLGEHWKG
jgi:phosphopantetheinyl transferase